MWHRLFLVLEINKINTAPMEGIFDPSFKKLTIDQKRELVHEMLKCPDDASEILQPWTRQDLLQILCAELGKERKFTGLTKSKIIQHLLKTMRKKKSMPPRPSITSPENEAWTPKRQKKSNHLINPNGHTTIDLDFETVIHVQCKNLACRAKMNERDKFCKRCSCCICHQYDENKDPGLWLICNTDPPFNGVSCGMSCHIECALRDDNSRISLDKGLDGSFCCVYCGKINDLLRTWRKQLVVARDTRRVDILCYRLSLGQKILKGSKQYQNVYGIVNDAVKKLEEEVGPLTGLPVKKARGIVNRLSSGPEIQRLCASAVESLDLLLEMTCGYNPLAHFEDINATSVTVNLNSSQSPSSFTNPAASNKECLDNERNQKKTLTGDDDMMTMEGKLPVTPCKIENVIRRGSSSKKRSGNGEKDIGYCVKVVRWLECEGYMEKWFREKFLTWYSLKATSEEVRVVKVFIDTFVEDPELLAEQLVDTFADVIDDDKSIRCSSMSGFCTKLWH